MSNQFLNSESIFEVIGNYPVVDQFDVLYANLQSGSYVDNYITGAMFTVAGVTPGVGFTFNVGERGLVFSKLGVNAAKLPSQDVSGTTNRSYNLQPWRERAGIIKNIKIFSNSERFYDSLVPSLYDMYRFNGGDLSSFYRNSPGGVSLSIKLSDYAGSLSGQMRMFPFESIFSKAKRVKRLEDGLGTTFPGFEKVKMKLLPRMFDAIVGYPFFSGGDAIVDTNTPPDGIIDRKDTPPGLTESDAAKILFGFGDLFNVYAPHLYPPYPAIPSPLPDYYYKGYNYLPTFRSSSLAPLGGGQIGIVCGPIIRGWRYGVLDGMPHYTSCVFRRDRFGQFRDMLEQRLYPVSYLDYDNAPSRYFGNVEVPPVPNPAADKKINETIEYPVTVTFVKQQTVTIGTPPDEVELLVYSEQNNRNQTWSSNLDTHATSSLPYFDLENTSLGRNRGEIPSSVINPEVVYTTI